MRLIRFLRHELAADALDWIERGIVTRDQANEILKGYGGSLSDRRRKSLGYYVLLGIGTLFMGLALIVLVSNNWQDIPRTIRLISLVVLTLFFNGGGLYYFRSQKIDMSRIWLFLGSLVYGASIFLIGQMYHLGEHFPEGVFLWALGVLPVALLTNSVLLMLLVTVLSGVWLMIEAQLGYFPALYPLFPATCLWFVVRQRRSIILFLLSVVGLLTYSELGLMHFLNDNLHRLDFGVEHVFFTAAACMLLYTLGRLLEGRSAKEQLIDYGLALRVWSMRFGIVTMFIFTFSEPWEQLIKAADQGLYYLKLKLFLLRYWNHPFACAASLFRPHWRLHRWGNDVFHCRFDHVWKRKVLEKTS